MRVAIPICNSRISPRFIFADKFYIFDSDNGAITREEVVYAGESHPLRRAKFVFEQNVDVVICSGIERSAAMQIGYHGIEIYTGVNGELKDVIQKFLNNELVLSPMEISGCGCRRCIMNSFSSNSNSNIPGQDEFNERGNAGNRNKGAGRRKGNCGNRGNKGRGRGAGNGGNGRRQIGGKGASS